MDFRVSLMSPPDCSFSNRLANIFVRIGSMQEGMLLNDFTQGRSWIPGSWCSELFQ
jgi:hypothetical protein